MDAAYKIKTPISLIFTPELNHMMPCLSTTSQRAASLVLITVLAIVLSACRSIPHARPRAIYEPELCPQTGRTTIPRSEDGNLQWRVVLLVNDEPGIFAVDTGAEKTVISREFAAKIGALPASEFTPKDKLLATDYRTPAARVINLKLGTYEYCDFYAPILEMAHINKAMKTKIDGILGCNVLGLTRCDMDFRHNKLTLDASPQPHPTGSIPIQVRHNRVFLHAKVNGRDAEFSLDTGSFATCMTKDMMRRLKIPERVKTRANAARIDIFESVQHEQTRAVVDSFEFSKIVKHKLPITEWNHTVLGMDLLQQWKLSFDLRAGWLLLSAY